MRYQTTLGTWRDPGFVVGLAKPLARVLICDSLVLWQTPGPGIVFFCKRHAAGRSFKSTFRLDIAVNSSKN